MSVSPLAEVHPEAVLGKEVVVEAFAKIGKDVIVGEGTWIGSNAVLYPGTRIGKACKIYPGAVISGEPQDLKFRGEFSTVEIGHHTTVREYATINRGTAKDSVTRVGKHSLIMAYAHIGHDCIVGNHCVIVNSVQVAGEVVLGDWVVIGGMSAVHQFCRIGDHAMISGMTGVLSDVAPYTKVFGVPAKFVGINTVGLARRGFTRRQIEGVKDIYRVLHRQGMNTSQALEYMEQFLDPSDEKEKVMAFIRTSKRGVIKGTNGMGIDTEVLTDQERA
jgi:UDP-N-acetylglucosamine acyltransferase